MPNKYGARKTEVDNIEFDSQAEARRYGELKLLEYNGDITNLIIHPLFPMVHDGQKICDYEADFSYCENGELIIEDTKGFLTDVYKLKRKMMKIFHHVDIFETG